MPRYSYVNGQYMPHNQAGVHIEDRGFLFADGIYEVIGSINGQLADEKGHLDRLERSLSELSIDMPVTRKTLKFLIRELLRKNRLKNAAVYIQITRGVAKRDFKFPKDTPSTLVLICWPFNYNENTSIKNGVKVISVSDQRWERRDIKTIALLPQTLAKQKAAEAGAYEAWMLDDEGMVNEGSSSNAWIYKNGKLFTHPADTNILKGVTRTAIEKIAQEEGIEINEKQFCILDACTAEEAFCSSATSLIVPVIEIDGHKIGGGTPGRITKKIYEQYRLYVEKGENEQLKWTP